MNQCMHSRRQRMILLLSIQDGGVLCVNIRKKRWNSRYLGLALEQASEMYYHESCYERYTDDAKLKSAKSAVVSIIKSSKLHLLSRNIDLQEVFKFSLGPISYSLARADGSLVRTNKAMLLKVIEQEIPKNRHIIKNSTPRVGWYGCSAVFEDRQNFFDI